MNALLHSMLETTRHAPRFHAILVHFPIAASILGLVLFLILLVTGGRAQGVRWSCFTVYALGAAAAYYAFLTGRAAAGEVAGSVTPVSDATKALIDLHGELGDKVWFFMLVAAVFTACTAFRMVAVRTTMLVLGILTCLVTASWIAVTAHYGGQLVYEHGVGVHVVAATTAPATMVTTTTTRVTGKTLLPPSRTMRTTTAPAAESPASKPATMAPMDAATQPAIER